LLRCSALRNNWGGSSGPLLPDSAGDVLVAD
jgi:hypothetical protein